MIFKLQRPIYSNNPNVGILCYNEDRSIVSELPMDENDISLVFGDEMKVFVEAEIEDGNLVISEMAEWQDW